MAPDAELTLEIVSPLFIGGAEPRAGDPAAEGLRVPSLRGALRYWFRALLAAEDRGKLAREEERLFGSAEVPSPLVVRVEPLSPCKALSWDQVKRAGGGSPPRGAGGWAVSGLGYLGDVALRATRGDPARSALPPGCRYRAVLRWRRRTPPGREESDRLAATVWLFSHLGSLGTRARRGFGAVQVAEVEAPGFLEASLEALRLPVPTRSPSELADELERARPVMRRHMLASRPVGEYPNLSVCEVRVVGDQTFPGWRDALEWVGGEYRAFRTRHPLRRRIPFGLPIPQRSGRPLSIDDLKRRASPIRFRPVKLASGSYALLAVLFKDQLFRETSADHSLLRSFFDSLGGRAIAFSP